jgi:transketolase
MDSNDFARQLRRLVVEVSKRAGVGHIASSLSIVDIVAVLFALYLDTQEAEQPRTRFVLSKGHAALALYGALHLSGRLTREGLNRYCADDSPLGVHPEHTVAGIDVSTGSLGQGLSLSAGSALATQIDGGARRTFCLLSDAELNEGSVWEAIMFAGHRRLGRLTAIIDFNGQQALGRTRDVLDLGSADEVAAKMSSFGWSSVVVDGHDTEGLAAALAPHHSNAPRMVVARTVAGHGVSFMEGQVAWHYLPLSDQQYYLALRELAAAG